MNFTTTGITGCTCGCTTTGYVHVIPTTTVAEKIDLLRTLDHLLDNFGEGSEVYIKIELKIKEILDSIQC